MSAESENGTLARQILDEYYRGFQERNPQLKVFSAHLHMDEATPHLHIDFVPFTTGSKRGLDTRVSLKQALAAQGFKGELFFYLLVQLRIAKVKTSLLGPIDSTSPIADNCMKDMLSMQNHLFQRQLYSLYFHQKNPLP